MFAQSNKSIIFIILSRNIRTHFLFPIRHETSRSGDTRNSFNFFSCSAPMGLMLLLTLLWNSVSSILVRAYPTIIEFAGKKLFLNYTYQYSLPSHDDRAYQSEKCRKLRKTSALETKVEKGYSFLLCKISGSAEDDNGNVLLQFYSTTTNI